MGEVVNFDSWLKKANSDETVSFELWGRGWRIRLLTTGEIEDGAAANVLDGLGRVGDVLNEIIRAKSDDTEIVKDQVVELREAFISLASSALYDPEIFVQKFEDAGGLPLPVIGHIVEMVRKESFAGNVPLG